MRELFTKFLLALAVCAGTFPLVGCNDDDDPVRNRPEVIPDTGTLYFTAGSYSKSFSVEVRNVSSWSLEVVFMGDAADWMTAEKKGDGVEVSVDPNDGAFRTATVFLKAPGMEDVPVVVEQDAPLESDIIGTYVPKREETFGGFYLSTAWNEKGAPVLKLGEGMDISWELVEMLLPGIVGNYYFAQGLVSLDFKADATIGVEYHRVLFEEDMSNILAPDFDTSEILVFPDEQTLAVMPLDALTFYTKEGKLYFAVDKRFIAGSDPGTLEIPICSFIDGLITRYGLGIVSDDRAFAVPFKYGLQDGTLDVYVDREMMLPFKKLLVDVIGRLLPAMAAAGTDGDGTGLPAIDPKAVTDFVEQIFDNSTEFRIGVRFVGKD